jgi:uncharacterized membrane protein YhaH (DUF805 family)
MRQQCRRRLPRQGWPFYYRCFLITQENSVTNPYSAPQADLHDAVTAEGTYQPSMFQASGRIGRLRYLAYAFGWGLLVSVPPAILMGLATPNSAPYWVLQAIVAVGSIVVTFMLGRRRLNDMGYRGWQSVGLLIPLVNLLVGLWLVFAPGEPGANRYGPPPAPNTRGVVAAALALPIIAIVGVVAALSIGAYQGYSERARSAASQGV